MTYSVWRADRGAFDYYESPHGVAENAIPKPSHIKAKSWVTPDEAAWPLPSDAQLVGSGEVARGMVANTRSGTALSGFDFPSGGWLVWLGFGLAAFAAWKLCR